MSAITESIESRSIVLEFKALPFLLVTLGATPETRFVPGGFKTEVPEPSAPEVLPSVLMVPLLAFDLAGYRLGYGGGFYDRTLTKLRAAGRVTAIGFAYEGQLVDAVPRAEYDQPLDAILTERVFRFAGHPSKG